MAKVERMKTDYAGVYWREIERRDGKGMEKIFYIMYRQGGRKSKLIEEPVGRSSEGMTEEKASKERIKRMMGGQSNAQRREAAEKELREKEAEITKTFTIGRLWEIYLADHEQNRAIRDDINRYNKHIAPAFADTLATEVTAVEISAFRHKLEKKDLSPQSVKHCLGLLKRIFRYARTMGHAVPEPIFVMPKVDNIKTEIMTEEQFEAYWHALDNEPNQTHAAFFKLALATGMRNGAICALKWSDIDFDNSMITLRREAAKNGIESKIPLNDAARLILESVPRESEYIFPGEDGQMRKVAPKMGKRVRAAAGLPDDFRPVHGLRHVFATRLAASGEVTPFALQQLMTHRSLAMTIRYTKIMDKALREASDVMNKILNIGNKKNS